MFGWTAMRSKMEKLLGEEFRVLAIQTRDRLHLTQKEMSKRLAMSESSYSDIETGRTACGALSEILLLNMQEDPNDFLSEVHAKFQKLYEEELVSV